MDRIKPLIASFLILASPVFADQSFNRPVTFQTGSTLTIQTGVTANGLVKGSPVDGDFLVFDTSGFSRKATSFEIFDYGNDDGTTFVPYWNTVAQHQWDKLLFSDDEALGNGATTLASQRATKAYIDGAVTIDASGFIGNLTTSDDTIQELAQAVDDLTVSGSGAPGDATYITETSNGSLSNEFAMSALGTGLVKNTTATGVPSIAVAGTDYLAPAAIGATVQAFDADLSLWAATTPLASYTVGDLLYASGTNTIGKIADTTTGGVLATGGVGVAPAYTNTPQVTSLTLQGGSLFFGGDQSQAAWLTTGIRMRTQASVFTDTTSSGTVALALTNRLGGNTIAASSATTYTNYYSLYVADPVAGTNVTFTDPYALAADTLKVIGRAAVGSIELGNILDTTISRASAGVVAVEGNVILVNGGGSNSTTLSLGTLHMGNASDTDVTRSAAGQIAIGGVDVLYTSNTKGVTNKTLNSSTNSISDANTYVHDLTTVPNQSGGWSEFFITASDFTSTTTTLGGTTVDAIVSSTLGVSTRYEFEFKLLFSHDTDAGGMKIFFHVAGTGSPAMFSTFTGNATGALLATSGAINAVDTAGNTFGAYASSAGEIQGGGFFATGTGSPTFSVRIFNVTGGTATLLVGSVIKIKKAHT